jgi:hypothetical protein
MVSMAAGAGAGAVACCAPAASISAAVTFSALANGKTFQIGTVKSSAGGRYDLWWIVPADVPAGPGTIIMMGRDAAGNTTEARVGVTFVRAPK